MAGRTLQQAMAYLGLAEQNEASRTEKRAQPQAYYEEDFEDLHAQGTEEAFGYHEHEGHLNNEEIRYDSSEPYNSYSESDPAASAPGAAGLTQHKIYETDLSHPYSDVNESEEELSRITTIHPRSYNDAKIIGESFRENIPVIMNVTDMGEAEAKRLVDFSAGLVFALHGSIERVTDKVFLLTPANLEVLGAEGAEVPVALDSDPSDLFNQD